ALGVGQLQGVAVDRDLFDVRLLAADLLVEIEGDLVTRAQGVSSLVASLRIVVDELAVLLELQVDGPRRDFLAVDRGRLVVPFRPLDLALVVGRAGAAADGEQDGNEHGPERDTQRRHRWTPR